MNNTNDTNLKTFVTTTYAQYEQGILFEIDRDSVSKALFVVNNIKINNRTDVLALLCSLNLLNAAIKSNDFKPMVSYSIIKGIAAKLVSAIDDLKDVSIKYYYNKDERCLY